MWWWRWTLGTVHYSIPRNLRKVPCRTMEPTHPCSWEDPSDCHSASHWSWYLPATSTLCSTNRLKIRRKNLRIEPKTQMSSRRSIKKVSKWYCMLVYFHHFALLLSLIVYASISIPSMISLYPSRQKLLISSQKMEIMTQSLPTTLLDLEKKQYECNHLEVKHQEILQFPTFWASSIQFVENRKLQPDKHLNFFHCFNDPIILTKFGYKSSEPTSLSHHVRSLFKNPVSNIYPTRVWSRKVTTFCHGKLMVNQPRCNKNGSSSVHELPRKPLSFPVKVTVTIRRCLRPGIFPPFPHSSPPPTNLSAIVVDLDDPRGLQSEQPPLSSPVSSKS